MPREGWGLLMGFGQSIFLTWHFVHNLVQSGRSQRDAVLGGWTWRKGEGKGEQDEEDLPER